MKNLEAAISGKEVLRSLQFVYYYY